MVLTGVFSFGAIKKETASAENVMLAQPFNEETVYNFAYGMVNDMEL